MAIDPPPFDDTSDHRYCINDTYSISDMAALESLYGPPAKFTRQESDHIHEDFRRFIEKAPFMVLATRGPNGLNASAKGDADGFMKVLDEKTILIPERGTNGRNDSLRNIVMDPHVALIFFIPGVSETIRAYGQAHLSVDPYLLTQFASTKKPPRLVIVVQIQEILCQCSRAIQQSHLWTSLLENNR
jgi:PPOX class probable FMN-dependent enzyme